MDEQESKLEKYVGYCAIALGLLFVISSQAWKASHRGGFDFFSWQTLDALWPYLAIAAALVFGHWLYLRESSNK